MADGAGADVDAGLLQRSIFGLRMDGGEGIGIEVEDEEEEEANDLRERGNEEEVRRAEGWPTTL